MKEVKVKGMSCQHCVASVTDALDKLDGTDKVNVDLDSGIARFEETSPVSDEAIKQAIKTIGFEVES